MAELIVQFRILEGDIMSVPKLPKCIPGEGNPNGCTTIAYAVIGPHEFWIDYVINYVARTNDLEIGKDIKLISDGASSQAYYNYTNYILSHTNETAYGIIFCTSE